MGMVQHVLKAVPHTPRKDQTVLAVTAEIIDESEDELDDVDVASATFVADVKCGKIKGSDPASAGIALPARAAQLRKNSALEHFLCEVDQLYRADEPLLALRRLLLLEKLVLQAKLRPLRERTEDARIGAVLRTEHELDPLLRTMLDRDIWTLISSKKEMQIETYLRVLAGGRAAVKVVGVLPHHIATMSAPLLHPDLYSTWIPGISFARQVGKPSNFRRLIYLRAMKVPVPFLARTPAQGSNQPWAARARALASDERCALTCPAVEPSLACTERDAVVVGYGDIYSPTSAIVYLTSLEPDDARVRSVAAQVDELSPESEGRVRMGLQGVRTQAGSPTHPGLARCAL